MINSFRPFGSWCDGRLAEREKPSRRCERALVDDANWSELERRFWSSTLSNPPLYGADSPGTLFDEKCASWNVGNLPSLLHALDHPIMGVSLPFLYWGQWKSLFSFHKEVRHTEINFSFCCPAQQLL